MTNIVKIIFARLGGFLVFLILLGLANFLVDDIAFLNKDILLFLNAQIFLLFLITIFFLVGELLNHVKLPFNLPAPIFNAIGSVMLVLFIFRVFGLIESFVDINLPFNLLSIIAYPIVFFIVLVFGYVSIFTGLTGKKPKVKSKKKGVKWEDVGEEFKLAFYELAQSLRRAFSKKKRKR